MLVSSDSRRRDCPVPVGQVAEYAEACLAKLGISADRVQLDIRDLGGCAAYAEPGLITLNYSLLRKDTWSSVGKRVVAHEAAHVAQFNSVSKTTGSPSTLEAEADLAAQIILDGGAYECTLRSQNARLHWNRAGHYYTVYYVSLIAGAPEYEAMWMAFCAQTPDLVSELDAPTQTALQATLKDSIGSSAAAAAQYFKFHYPADPGIEPTDYEICTDVIEGLHCLTGASVVDERRRRISALDKAGWNSLDFGIGLHALGDAWAHCSGGSMYGSHHGHMFAGHGPDDIHKNLASYMEYATALYGVIRSKVAGAPRLDFDIAMEDLRKNVFLRYADGDDEPNQIREMRSRIDNISNLKALVNYRPENDCSGWKNFRTREGGRGFAEGDKDRILSTARRWRVSPRDDSGPEARAAKRLIELRGSMMREPKF